MGNVAGRAAKIVTWILVVILILTGTGWLDPSAMNPVEFIHAGDIASYLKRFGWKPGISRAKAKKAIHHYNHSDYYVNTILKIAERLKG
jgi:hypothetical protein